MNWVLGCPGSLFAGLDRSACWVAEAYRSGSSDCAVVRQLGLFFTLSACTEPSRGSHPDSSAGNRTDDGALQRESAQHHLTSVAFSTSILFKRGIADFARHCKLTSRFVAAHLHKHHLMEMLSWADQSSGTHRSCIMLRCSGLI